MMMMNGRSGDGLVFLKCRSRWGGVDTLSWCLGKSRRNQADPHPQRCPRPSAVTLVGGGRAGRIHEDRSQCFKKQHDVIDEETRVSGRREEEGQRMMLQRVS